MTGQPKRGRRPLVMPPPRPAIGALELKPPIEITRDDLATMSTAARLALPQGRALQAQAARDLGACFADYVIACRIQEQLAPTGSARDWAAALNRLQKDMIVLLGGDVDATPLLDAWRNDAANALAWALPGADQPDQPGRFRYLMAMIGIAEEDGACSMGYDVSSSLILS